MALADLRFRQGWAVFSAIGIQILIISVFPGTFPEAHPFVHMGTYLLAGYFLFANRHLPGFWLIGLGGLLNFLAIASNGGTMPASASALATAGLLNEAGGEFLNSTTLGNPNLAFLGDIFATPSWIPFANVFSLGDVCIVLGTAVGLHRICGSRLVPRLVPGARGEFTSLLQERAFMRVWASQAASNVGDFAYSLVVLVSLTERGFGPKILATLLIVQVAPAALTGLFGAPLIDRFSRKRLMIGSDVMRAVAVGSLLFAPSPSLAHFYVVAAFLGTFGALFRPSLAASLPNLVPRNRLVAANSVVASTFHISIMAGPMLGGLLATHLGTSSAFAINAASFAVSAAILVRLRLPHHPVARTRARTDAS